MKNNMELARKFIDTNVMFLQRVCEKHEWVEVTTTIPEINKSTVAWQCRLCGKCKSGDPFIKSSKVYIGDVS